MKTVLRISIAIGFLTILAACASRYRPIMPDKVFYNAKATDNGVEFGYKYDVLNERGNKKYAKKESKKGVKVVAIKLTNNTEQPLRFGENIKIFSGDREIQPLESSLVVSSLKQNAPIYLLFLLLTPLNLYIVNDTETTTIPIGLALGPGIAIGNMATAGTANKKFQKELTDQSLANKTIQPRETVYGLIGISDRGFNPLTVKVLNNN